MILRLIILIDNLDYVIVIIRNMEIFFEKFVDYIMEVEREIFDVF